VSEPRVASVSQPLASEALRDTVRQCRSRLDRSRRSGPRKMRVEFRFATVGRASSPRSSEQHSGPSSRWPSDAGARAQRFSDVAAEMTEHPPDNPLSSREVDVLRLIAAGNSNRRIADRLSIKVATVKSHVTNIFAKLGAHDRAHAVAIGLTRGIFEP
jgi:DNA-binding NarL/FixJ family response regulator